MDSIPRRTRTYFEQKFENRFLVSFLKVQFVFVNFKEWLNSLDASVDRVDVSLLRFVSSNCEVVPSSALQIMLSFYFLFSVGDKQL